MDTLSKRTAELQEACRTARRGISHMVKEYKEALRKYVPLPIDYFPYELETFSQVAYYLNVPMHDMFTYEDWADYISELISASEAVRMRKFSDRARLESLRETLVELRRAGKNHWRFMSIWNKREEILNAFLNSPKLLMKTISNGVPTPAEIVKIWNAEDETIVELLNPVIQDCTDELSASPQALSRAKRALSSREERRKLEELFADDGFVGIYDYIKGVVGRFVGVDE